jgi:molybdate-binding protein
VTVARYREIADALLHEVASGELTAGATLPSVRSTAARLGAAPATVGRAYAELSRRGVIDAAPRRAAHVATDGALLARRALAGGRTLRLAGSDDPLLDRICAGADRVGARGSFGGLAALWQGRADAATLHLRHRDGTYNASFAAGVLDGRRPVLVHLWRREQGIIVAPGNPDGVEGLADLRRCVVALRPAGTGTRVLLERLMRDTGLDPSSLRGPEVGSHLEAALSVASASADAAIGLRASAEAMGLDFLPLAWEPYELALSDDALGLAGDLLHALHSAPRLPGFDLSETGTVRRLAASGGGAAPVRRPGERWTQPRTSTPSRY